MAEIANLELSSESDNHTIYLLDDSSSDDGTIYLIDDDDAAISLNREIFVKSQDSASYDMDITKSENRIADHESDDLNSENHIQGEILVRRVSDEYADEDENCDGILELILMAELHCVGLQHYSGVAHQGEYVRLIREPHNVYDRCAIRVDNMRGERIGNIKATEARAMTQIMDDTLRYGVQRVDGIIPRPGNAYSQPILLELYGFHRIMEDDIRKLLRSSGIDVFTSRSSFLPNRPVTEDRKPKAEPGYTPVPQPSIEPPKMESSTIVLDWKSEEDLDAVFDQQQQNLKHVPLVNPPLQMITNLMAHQLLGLSWLYHRENTDHVNPLFYQVKEKGKTVWMSTVTQSSQVQEPAKICGRSLICDDMGMGKTIMTIALILKSPPADVNYGVSQKPKTGALKSTMNNQTASCITTLIVCPVSVMSNWMTQVDQHVKPGTLRIATLQGSNRASLLEDIFRNRFDVVLVSYQTLAFDYKSEFGDEGKEKAPPVKKKKHRSIFSLRFHRIVLDEAHIIRNPKTSMSKACLKIDAQFKLGLTGTPIQNKAEDACTLFQFLGVEPLSNSDIFRRSVSQPIRQGNPTGFALLRTIFSHFALRRTKEKEGIKLPEKSIEICKINFSEGSSVYKKIYDSLFLSGKTAFAAILSAGDQEALKEYMSILELILRLRQACCVPILISPNRLKAAEAVCKEIERRNLRIDKPMTAAEGRALLEKLHGVFEENADGTAECAICLEDFAKEKATILRTCKHAYCEECITNVRSINPRRCPLCRKDFEDKDVVKLTDASKAAAKNGRTETQPSQELDDFSEENLLNSPKICMLILQLRRMRRDEKGVIFSQFTQFLDVIGRALDKAEFSFTRIDGTMSAERRIQAMKDFQSDAKDAPRLILCSLHAAGTGINLVRGNWCFMMDLWWNKAVEDQAMDRIHRIGQTRPVTVVKLIIQDTLEENILRLQESKALILKGSLEKISSDEMSKARLSALKGLFGIGNPERHD